MANVVISPNMNLPVPVVGQEIGPQWATDINNCLALIDAHTHDPALKTGVQITPSGIDINADLTFNSVNNAIDLRSVRFTPQSAALSGPSDVGCLYEVSADLYYNDGAGNQIRITQSGSVSGASGTITGLPSGTASASFSAISGTFVFQQATSTGANLDVASIAIRYPGSYPTPTGNYIQLEAPSSLASGYALILPALPVIAIPAVLTLSSAGVISAASTQMITQDLLALRSNTPVAGTFPAGAIATSATATVTITSVAPAYDNVASVTLVTLGRPVAIMLQTDGSGSGGGIQAGNTGLDIIIGRSGTSTAQVYNSTITASIFVPPNVVGCIDVLAAGTYTWLVQAGKDSPGTSGFFTRVKLVAYEI